MFKLIVEPENPKKLTVEDYQIYEAAMEALRMFEKNKVKMDKMPEVNHATAQLKAKVKAFRKEVRELKMKYTLVYKCDNKAWAKALPDITHSFIRDAFHSDSILKNKKHLPLHKSLTSPALVTKSKAIKDAMLGIRHTIQQKKAMIRQPRLKQRSKAIQKSGGVINYMTCGAVIYKRRPSPQRGVSIRGKNYDGMGVFVRYLKSKDKERVFVEKKPTTTSDNYVGVEIEFGCDLNDQDLAFALMEAEVHDYVFLKRDGSVHVGPFNHELCVLGKEKEIFSIIEKVCECLATTGAKVNKTCGLHVHIDMRNRNTSMVFNNLVCAQNVLYAMNPYARQAGTYCRKVDTKDFQIGAKIGHYAGVNASAHEKHKTIEIRIHSGTVNAKKINNWIKLLLMIANKKEVVKKASSRLTEFVLKFGLDQSLADYIHERMNKFMGTENNDVTEDGVA
jgi:Putative amidoligase enzyme